MAKNRYSKQYRKIFNFKKFKKEDNTISRTLNKIFPVETICKKTINRKQNKTKKENKRLPKTTA